MIENRDKPVSKAELFRDRSTDESLFNFQLNRKIISFSTLIKAIIVGILVASIILLLSISYDVSNTPYFPVYVVSFLILGFLFWVVTLFLVFSISITKTESSIIKLIFPLLMILGILTAYFSVVIENKAFSIFTVINSVLNQMNISPLNPQKMQYVFYTIVIPLIEEIAKIFPVIMLLGNYARLSHNKFNYETRLVPSLRMAVFLGGFFGAWFDLIEQFLSYSTLPTNFVTRSLLFGRTVYPLHSVSSMIVALGIGIIFIGRSYPRKVRILVFSVFLFLGTSFHGLVNYYSVVNENLTALSIMNYSSYVLYIFFALILLIKIPKYCLYCFTEHLSSECPVLSEKSGKLAKVLKSKPKYPYLYKESEKEFLCSNCFTRNYNSEYCDLCWSFPKLQCNNCNQLVPAFARNCWSCGREVTTLYDKMNSSSPPLYVSFSVGFTRVIFMGILISLFFIFMDIQSSVSFLGYVVFIVAILLALLITFVWFFSTKNRVQSMLSSIIVTSIVVLALIVSSLYMGVFALSLIFSFRFLYGFTSLICVIVIFFVSIAFLIKVISGSKLILGEGIR